MHNSSPLPMKSEVGHLRKSKTTAKKHQQNGENHSLQERTPHEPHFYRIFMDSEPVWDSWKDLRNRKSGEKSRPQNKSKKRGRQDLVRRLPAPPWGWLGGTLGGVRGEPRRKVPPYSGLARRGRRRRRRRRGRRRRPPDHQKSIPNQPKSVAGRPPDPQVPPRGKKA